MQKSDLIKKYTRILTRLINSSSIDAASMNIRIVIRNNNRDKQCSIFKKEELERKDPVSMVTWRNNDEKMNWRSTIEPIQELPEPDLLHQLDSDENKKRSDVKTLDKNPTVTDIDLPDLSSVSKQTNIDHLMEEHFYHEDVDDQNQYFKIGSYAINRVEIKRLRSLDSLKLGNVPKLHPSDLEKLRIATEDPDRLEIMTAVRLINLVEKMAYENKLIKSIFLSGMASHGCTPNVLNKMEGWFETLKRLVNRVELNIVIRKSDLPKLSTVNKPVLSGRGVIIPSVDIHAPPNQIVVDDTLSDVYLTQLDNT
jgi:hypothetical protein